MYATQEIHQSASEVQPENSLAAIADQVDQAAADLDPNVTTTAPSYNDHSSSQHTMGGSSAYHSSQQPDWNPQHSAGGGHNGPFTGHYGSGVRQQSAPGDYPNAGAYAAGSTDGHAPGASDGGQMAWDPNAAAAAAYYAAGNGGASYPAFQPQALHHASAGYPFSAHGGAQYPQSGGASAYESNPYFAAATGYLGFPEGAAPGFPPGADAYGAGAAPV